MPKESGGNIFFESFLVKNLTKAEQCPRHTLQRAARRSVTSNRKTIFSYKTIKAKIWYFENFSFSISV